MNRNEFKIARMEKALEIARLFEGFQNYGMSELYLRCAIEWEDDILKRFL
jgi:hypothetical protein